MTKLTSKHTYRKGTPEELAYYDRLRKQLEAEKPEISKRAREAFDNAKRTGMPPRTAIPALRRERTRQGLTDDDMIARSGLDGDRLASMAGRDANPTIETLEAYAQALGKKLLLILADDEEGNRK